MIYLAIMDYSQGWTCCGQFCFLNLAWTMYLPQEKKCVFSSFFFSCSPLREKQTKERISRWKTKVCCLHFRLEDLRKSFNGRAYVSTFPKVKESSSWKTFSAHSSEKVFRPHPLAENSKKWITLPLGPLSRKVYTAWFATKIIPCKLYDCMRKMKGFCPV